MRVAVFAAGGPIALHALDALAATHTVAVVVRDNGGRPWRTLASSAARAAGLRPPDQVDAWAHKAGVPILRVDAGRADDAARLRAFRTDLGCIATFPRRIAPAWREACGPACLNLHPSLLPRHRGPNPLFWTYHAGDRQAGVTIHVATDRLDAGGIVASEAFPVARGESALAVHARGAAAGARLLASALGGYSPRAVLQQDESAMTRAPSPTPGRRYADLGHWSAEQAWHFLAGLLPLYREPLHDVRGAQVSYRRVDGFELRRPEHPAGSVVRNGAGWSAWTVDGVVHLSDAPQP